MQIFYPSFTTFLNLQCRNTEAEPGDEIDNDCDGQIDEESRDGKDNDGDGFIDEDIKRVIFVLGVLLILLVLL